MCTRIHWQQRLSMHMSSQQNHWDIWERERERDLVVCCIYLWEGCFYRVCVDVLLLVEATFRRIYISLVCKEMRGERWRLRRKGEVKTGEEEGEKTQAANRDRKSTGEDVGVRWAEKEGGVRKVEERRENGADGARSTSTASLASMA